MIRKVCVSTFALLLFLLVSGLVSQVAAQSKVNQPNQSKTERLLKEIKANYRPFQGAGTFIISYKGKEKSDIDLIVVESDGAIVILADVVAGTDVDLTSEVMRKLLEFNMRADYIKVGISNIRSIRIQSEQDLLLISGKVLGKILDQVAAGVDDVAGIVASAKRSAGADK
jgi:type IV secretory pathway VirB6-like protein